MRNNIKFIILIICLLGFGVIHIEAKIIYVNSYASGSDDGSSWANAYKELQKAIDISVAGDEIWVAQGIYIPTGPVGYNGRDKHFLLKANIKLYGGFKGNEESIDDRQFKDTDGSETIDPWELKFPTILSGGNSFNKYNVVVIPNGATNCLLDGFTIQNGKNSKTKTWGGSPEGYYASGIIAFQGTISRCLVQDCVTSSNDNKPIFGGGIYIKNAKVQQSKVLYCEANSSTGDARGGGIYSDGSIIQNTTVMSCKATGNNSTNVQGGGIFCKSASSLSALRVFNCKTQNSSGEDAGGGIFMQSSSCVNSNIFNCESGSSGGGIACYGSYLTNNMTANCEVTENTGKGGGVYADNSTVKNSVLWNNQAFTDSKEISLNNSSNITNIASVNQTTNIKLEPENEGGNTALFYAYFKKPTDFIGEYGKNFAKVSAMLKSDWSLNNKSALCNKGDNNAFNEASVNYDLNGDGDKNDDISAFTDFEKYSRLFGSSVDIGACEFAFIKIIVPDEAPSIEYGNKLSEITVPGLKAVDVRDNSEASGTFAFASPDFIPQADKNNQSFPVSFTASTSYGTPQIILNAVVEIKIIPKEVSLTGITIKNKVYDGTDVAQIQKGSLSISGIVNGDNVSVVDNGIEAKFENKNVGNNKKVTLSKVSLGGTKAANYSLPLDFQSTANITKRDLTINGVTVSDKIYDGTTKATFTTSSVTGKIDGDDISYNIGEASATFSQKNAGNNISVTINTDNITLSGDDSGNYSLKVNVPSSGSYSANITPRTISVAGISVANKVYDGTVDATVSGTPTITNIIDGDNVSLNSSSVSVVFNNKNAGQNKLISVSGYNLSGSDKSNYTLVQPSGITADITHKKLTLSGVNVKKTYDGAVNFSFSSSPDYTLEGKISGDNLSLGTSINGVFNDANVGKNKLFTINSASLNGTDKINYLIEKINLDIVAKEIIPDGIVITDKEYDGSTSAVFSQPTGFTGMISGDDLSLDAASAICNFVDSSVGNNKKVVFTNLVLDGASKDNYILKIPTSVTGNITHRTISVENVSVENKVYDGKTKAIVTGSPSLNGVLSGEDVSLIIGAANFNNKNVGNDKPVVFSGFSVTGTHSGNYIVSQPDNIKADITPAELTISNISAQDKKYDGSTNVQITGFYKLSGAIEGDDVSLSEYPKANFIDKNVGDNKKIVLSSNSLSGTDKNNYTLTTKDLFANITPRDIKPMGVVIENKQYDGTKEATIKKVSNYQGMITSDDVALDFSKGNVLFAQKNVGNNIVVSFFNMELTGNDAANYSIVMPDNSNANIIPRKLNIINLKINDKVYDANTNASFNSTPELENVISGDDVTLNIGTANFPDKNAGEDKTVVFSGFNLSGSDKLNYELINPESVTASISKAEIKVTGITVNNKVYDAKTDATYSGNINLNGVISGDDVSVGSSVKLYFEDANAGNNKKIIFSSIELNGVDKNNYLLINNDISADITPLEIVVEALPVTKLFDESDPELVYNVTKGELLAGDSFSGSLSRSEGEEPGEYNITIGTLAISPNYSIDFKPNKFSIVLKIQLIKKGDNILLIDNSKNLFTENKYQWYKNNKPIEGETKQYLYSENGLNGIYVCEVTYKDQKIKSLSFVASKGIAVNSVNVYPNPIRVNQTFNVKLNGYNHNENNVIRIYDMNGYLIKTVYKTDKNNSVRLNKSGLYFIKINNENIPVGKIICK